jgi:hypothetical protein
MEQKIHDIRSISLLLALNKTVRPASGALWACALSQ